MTGVFPYNRVHSTCVHQGLIKKRVFDGGKESWKECWAVLYFDCLLFYKTASKKAPKMSQLATSIIFLRDVAGDAIQEISKTNALSIPTKDGLASIFIQTRSSEEQMQWVGHIRDQAKEVEVTHNRLKQNRQDLVSLKNNALIYEWFTVSPFSGWLKKKTKARKSTSRRRIIFVPEEKTLLFDITTKFYQDRMLLKSLVKTMSTTDEFYTTERAIRAACKKYSFYGIVSLLDKHPYKRPHSLSADTTESAFNRLETLNGMRNALRKKATKVNLNYPQLVDALDRMDDLLSQLCHDLKCHPLQDPPTIILGNYIGQRILPPLVAEAILRGEDDPYGLHKVTSYAGMHFKQNPESPGQEYMMDCLYKLLFSSASSPSELLKIIDRGIEYKVQASHSVPGVNLREVLEKRPDLVLVTDSENFTTLFILGILTNLHDGKPDNFVMQLHSSGRSMEIVGIDNDLAFADQVVVRNNEFLINVRNVLYLFPQMSNPLNFRVRRNLLNMSPEIVILEWLRLLSHQNTIYTSMKGLIFSQEELESLELPIRLRAGTAAKLYKDMIALKVF